MRAVSLCAALVVAAACGSDSTGPRRPLSNILFVAGNHQTDTIQASLNQALVVRIFAPPGQSVANQIVRFSAVPDSGSGFEALVEPLTSTQPVNFVADSLTASGQASVVVVLGTKVGRARVAVDVPAFGFSDTAVFTITAGRPAAISTSPRDTLVVVGATVTLKTAVTDRFGNPRTELVTLRIASGPATVSGATITTTDAGRVQIVGSVASFTDTTFLSVVPHGKLAASAAFASIAMFNLDGTGLTTITPSALPVGNLKWAPSGTALVYDQSNGCGAQTNRILRTDLNGATTVIDQNNLTYDQYASFSRDGTWIYYSRNTGGSSANWRAHVDGTADDSLTTLMPDFDIFPSPSNDGLRMAYVAIHGGTTSLRVLTLSSGAVADLGVASWSPEWSPTSDQIAYIAVPGCVGAIDIVHADGSGNHALTTSAYLSSFDWSPDSKWIVAKNANTGLIDLINSATGLTIPLPYSGSMYAPTWLPTS